jgi:formiminotetrahydrofolate cyclodeaminase
LNLEAAEISAGDTLAALGSVDHPAAAGSAAALTGALAAAIVCKAARSAARPATAAQAISLQERLLRLARADAEVLAAARTALRPPHGPETGTPRDFALGQALRNSSVVPAGIAETCADVARLAETEHGSVEPDFAPDVTAAAVLAAGAAHAAASLVAVNLLACDNEADVAAARHAAATAAEVVARLVEP